MPQESDRNIPGGNEERPSLPGQASREQRESSDSSSRRSSREEKVSQSNSSGDPVGKKPAGEKLTAGLGSAAATQIAGKSEAAQKTIENVKKTRQAAIVSKAVAIKLFAGLKAFGATLLPPHGPFVWGLFIIVLIVGYVGYGMFLSTGRNDNRALCLDDQSMNSQIGSISTDATEREIAQEIGAFLTNETFEAFGGPLSTNQAAGLIGNMIHESAGLRPYVRQGNANDTTLMSNSEVRQWRISTSGSATGSNAAIGMIQWDGARAEQLIKFAESNNTEWYEFDLQMEFLANEMNTGYEAQQIRGNSSLISSTGSVDTYTVGFQNSFFRPNAALAYTDRRLAAAIEFLEYFEEGAFSGSHGYTICNDSAVSNLAVGEIAETAMQMSWEWKDVNKAKANCSWNSNGGQACGKEASKPEYVEGKELAHSQTGMDGLSGGDLYASCDRFVATVLRVTGVDEGIPWGNSDTQKAYLAGSSKWKDVDSGTAGSMDWKSMRPGDVLAANGHIAIYIGVIDGQEMVANASIQSNYHNNGRGMSGYQGPLASLGSLNYTAFRAA